MDELARFAGRLHPLLVHFPIALVLTAGAAEWLRRPSRPSPSSPAVFCLAAGACAAPLAAAAGWIGVEVEPLGRSLAGELRLHRWSGVAVVATALVALAACLVSRAGTRPRAFRAYRLALALACAATAVAGHLGATLVHGGGYLLDAFRPPSAPPTPVQASAGDAAAERAPQAERPEAAEHDGGAELWPRVEALFAARCIECHGGRRTRGGLRLTEPADLFAGDPRYWVVRPGDAEHSELHRRVRLPADDPDRMPSEGEPLRKDEVGLLRDWIDAGAAWDTGAPPGPDRGSSGDGAPAGEAADGAAPPASGAAPAPDAPAPQRGASDRLRERGARVAPVADGSPRLAVDLASASPPVGDDDLALLTGLEERLGSLDLTGAAVSAAGVQRLTAFGALRRLVLARTDLDAEALAPLVRLGELRELDLSGTPVGDDVLPLLLQLPALERVDLGRTAVSDRGRAALERTRPELTVVAGAAPEARSGSD